MSGAWTILTLTISSTITVDQIWLVVALVGNRRLANHEAVSNSGEINLASTHITLHFQQSSLLTYDLVSELHSVKKCEFGFSMVNLNWRSSTFAVAEVPTCRVQSQASPWPLNLTVKQSKRNIQDARV